MYPEVSAPMNVVGLHHPWTSVQNVFGGLCPRECGGIASSLNFGSKCIRRSRPPWMWWDCIILELQFKMYPEVSAPMNVVGLHHPWTSVQNVFRGLDPRECGRIASSLNFCSKCFQKLWSPWMWWDYIIPEHLFKMYLKTSVPVNVVGFHHPWNSIQNVSGGFGPCECCRIASSLDIVLKW